MTSHAPQSGTSYLGRMASLLRGSLDPTPGVEVPASAIPITNRDQFPDLLKALDLKGNGIELGVAAGSYSHHLLAHSGLRRLFSVDRWSDHHNDAEYQSVRKLFEPYGGRSVILRMTFQEAAPLFADNVFDFIFLDGYAHAGQDGVETLETWWPKLRRGGVFAGHDYHSAWPLTIQVVDQFVARRKLKLHLTQEDPALVEHAYPSWYVFK